MSEPSLDHLIKLKAKLEEIIAAQPHRKRQLARQLAEINDKIDSLRGQKLLF